MSYTAQAIGQQLRVERLRAGASEADIARRLGVTRALISGRERGQLFRGVERLADHCAALGVDLVVFLQRVAEAERASGSATRRKAGTR